MSALRRLSASLPAGGFALSRFLGPAQPSQKRLAKSKAGNPDAIGCNITPQPGAPAHEGNTVHPRSGQDLPRRATRRLQALRKPKAGTVDKTVTDFYEEKVTDVRYRRSDCGSAFRVCLIIGFMSPAALA